MEEGAGVHLYAAMLRLEHRLCVVIGGGKVALRKVDKLLSAGARVRVISPVAVSALLHYSSEGRIEYIDREYQKGDAGVGFLIIAATDQPEVNRQIAQEAEQSERLVNVIDDPQQCSLMVPASYHQDGLQVAISTEGRDPAGAKRLKDTLAADFRQGTRFFQDEVRTWWHQHMQ